MAFHNIAIAGATGYLGRKVLSHLLTIQSVQKITVLTRSMRGDNLPSSPIISIVPVPSYEDHDALTSVIQGHDLLISTLNGIAALEIDRHLISAAISTGIQRFMPSEYTLDVMHPHAIEVAGSTVLTGRIRNARELESLAENGEIEYTTLVPGAILDWWFENGTLGVDMKGKKVTLYDGGEKQVTGSTTDFIANCVGAVVRLAPETTKNRRIRIAEVTYSGLEILRAFKEVTGEKWEVEEKSTDSLLVEGKKAGARGDMRGFYLGNILKLNFDGEGAAFFQEGLSFGDKPVERRSLKDIVKAAASVKSE
jgi:uncharacterized protein YbjT (DUF2867 family)